MHKPYTRWTADTEIAFLMALKATGTVRKAAEAIGRAVGSAYKRRERHPAFRAKWDAAVAEQQAAWIAAYGVKAERSETRERYDGWSRLRRRAFLRALSETGEVRAACERVGISDTSVYRLRKRSPVFARDFAAALERSVPMIEQVAWERAVEGWEEPIVVRGEVVGTRRRFSEPLLRTLLAQALAERRAEAKAAAGGKGRSRIPVATREETNAALLGFLQRFKKKKRAALFEQAEAWERMQAEAGGGSGDGWVRPPRDA